MVLTRDITTAEQLLEAGDIGRCELIRGRLHMMSPAGNPHGQISSRIAGALFRHVTDPSIGVILLAEPGFILERRPDTVRAPDIAFIRGDRAPAADEPGYIEGAPDLAVEVLSPNDRPSDVARKTSEWLAAGAMYVWNVDPVEKTITVHKPQRPAVTLRVGDTLTAPDLVPGFSLELSTLFAP